MADAWQRSGWQTRPKRRRASEIGEPKDKPFLRDLLDQAYELATSPSDWLLIGNVDCSLAPDFYEDLAGRRGTAVEYQRQDVYGEPTTLAELYSRPNRIYDVGMDAYALRASWYGEVRPHFPDFILGDPHWDTALTGILRHHLPVQRDQARLFHPAHEQAWDLGHLSPGGAHNNRIYLDMLHYGFARDHVIREVNDRTDTAIVLAVFGNDPLRVTANIEAIRRQLEQDLLADFYLVELLDGEASLYPEDILSRVIHVPVRAKACNEGLFQKEALFNRGWRTALESHRYDYFLFVDADVYSESPDWFRQIRARLRQQPTRAVQGFGVVTDTVDPEFEWTSLAASYRLARSTDLSLNPGICWGLHREMLVAADGLNPFSLASCGDSMFVAEFLNSPSAVYDPWLHGFRFFSSLYRDLPFRAEFDCVPVKLIHCHHGPAAERNYDGSRYALDGMRPVREWVELDAEGLLAWKELDCSERRLMRERLRMTSRAAVDALFAELGLRRHNEGDARPGFVPREKPLFAIPGWVEPGTLGPLPEGPLPEGPLPEGLGPNGQPVMPSICANRLNLYHPQRIFRQCFPFSWCGNVRADETRHIPSAVRDGVPRLILDGLPGVPWVSGLLAMDTNWLGIDLTSYRQLHFTLMAEGETVPDPMVGFVVVNAAGEEVDTPVVHLKDYGLPLGVRQDYCFPLELFWTEASEADSRRRVRLVRWSGGGSFRMELSQVYID